jgi:hypothetical protein
MCACARRWRVAVVQQVARRRVFLRELEELRQAPADLPLEDEHPHRAARAARCPSRCQRRGADEVRGGHADVLKKTSQNSASSVICRSGRTLMPGLFMSTRSRLMPCASAGRARCGRGGSASRDVGVARPHLRPFTTYSSPRCPRVRRPAGRAGARLGSPGTRARCRSPSGGGSACAALAACWSIAGPIKST